jgi:hypothetical protein
MQQLEKNLPSDLGAATQQETPQSDSSQLASERRNPSSQITFFYKLAQLLDAAKML